MEIKHKQFGVRLEARGENDPHVCFQLLTEDDEYWGDTDTGGSTYWLDDLIGVLQAAKTALETSPEFEKEKNGYGWDFKKK
jgi:hypothetical protein